MATRPPAVRLDRLPTWAAEGVAHVVVEAPRGSAVKLKYEPALGAFTVSRPLVLGFAYPFEFGFFPSTKAEDGDPLDAIVLTDVATFPGVVRKCRALGILRASQKAKGGRVRNDRVVTIAVDDRRLRHLHDVRELSAREREEIEAFVHASVALEDKEVELLGWGDASAARAAIEAARPGRRAAAPAARRRRSAKRK